MFLLLLWVKIMKRKTCSLVRIELVRGDVVIFFPIHNATTSDRWTWPLLNQSMAIANCKCNASDTSLLTNQFLPSHFGFTTNFFILIIIPSVPHRITKSTKLPRDLFLFILQPKQCLWFFLYSFLLSFFSLINGVSGLSVIQDHHKINLSPESQVSIKLSRSNCIIVGQHLSHFFNTHVTSL